MGRSLIYAVGRAIVDLYGDAAHQPLKDVAVFNKYVGGSAANTAVGLARLGQPVGMISCVGRDPFGDFIQEQLQREGIDTQMLARTDRYQTGVAFAALFPPHDSEVWFLGVPNANAALEIADVDWEAAEAAQAFVIGGSALAAPSSRAVVMRLIAIAKARQVPWFFDVDWRPVYWHTADDEPVAIYREALEGATAVLANAPELAWVGQSDQWREAADRLLALGVHEVVAKRGKEGAWIISRDGAVHAPAYAVSVVNTLGAGDGFGAGFVDGYLRGLERQARLEFANACGAIVVTRHSCSQAMPTRREVEEFLVAQGGGRL